MSKNKVRKLKPDKLKKIVEDIFESSEINSKKPVKKKKTKKQRKKTVAKKKTSSAAKKRQKQFQDYINKLKKSYKKLLKEIGLYKTSSRQKTTKLDLLVDDLFNYSKNISNKPTINSIIFSKTIKELNKIMGKNQSKKSRKKKK